MTDVPSPDDLRAKVFPDREGRRRLAGREDGERRIAPGIFAGPNARGRALAFAWYRYRKYDEIVLDPHRLIVRYPS
jgi:hypothetical protein